MNFYLYNASKLHSQSEKEAAMAYCTYLPDGAERKKQNNTDMLSDKQAFAQAKPHILQWPSAPKSAPGTGDWPAYAPRSDKGQPAHAGTGLAGDSAPLLLSQRASPGKSIREEMPRAVNVYGDAVACVRKHMPFLIFKKKILLGEMEETASTIVESLSRNREALLCLTRFYRHKVYMYSHLVNVGIMLAAFSLDFGRSQSESAIACVSGLLHDSGMALLPLSILQSSTELTPTEKILLKRHPAMACDLFAETPEMYNDVFLAALEHHEHFDGQGYPGGLSGNTVSFIGYLTAIASAYDAMTSRRRHNLTPLCSHDALSEMFRQRSKQFHPAILENFIRLVGVFPIGTVVLLRDGYYGVVSSNAPDLPLRPTVLLIRDPKGRPMEPVECDMAREPVAPIVRGVSPDELGIDVHRLLGIPASP